ncbi:DUF5675 family protein [Labilibacter marinus]|uniref:DUF5675 family protein n=1 Tax=Labilibacter marinus TaxID=1477105 RepID=UPI0008363178|nr:DUF5675 family protein [Labilibacter marinus]
MELTVVRYSSGKECTLGLLLINGTFAAYTLEDEGRDTKVYDETRIPAGRYQIKLRKEGRVHESYEKRFPEIHKGTLHLQNVPNFKWILIHIGNDDDDTAGCLLVGDKSVSNIKDEGRIESSTIAYKRIYPIIANTIDLDEEVWITYLDQIPIKPIAKESYKVANVIPSQLNIRSTPQGAKKGVLFENTGVVIKDQVDDWSKVSFEGWVHSEYILSE